MQLNLTLNREKMNFITSLTSYYSIKEPWALSLLILIPFFLLIIKKSVATLSPFKKRAILSLRISAFTLLVLSLAGLSTMTKSDSLYVVYIIDNSDSFSNYNIVRAMEVIQESMSSIGRNDKVATMVFGKRAIIQSPFSNSLRFYQRNFQVDNAHTNIQEAIKTAELIFPPNVQKRIVLFTDGNETEGNAVKEAAIASEHGIELIAVAPMNNDFLDFKVESLSLPHNVSLNEPFEVKIVMSGNQDDVATLRITMDKNEIFRQDVNITKGEKKVVAFQQAFKGKGAHIFDVELINPNDAHIQNNSFQDFIFVTGEPSVLCIFDGEKKSTDIIKVLEKNKIKVDVATPELLEPTISFLSKYDAIILDNVPATDFSTIQMKSIQDYVKTMGGGLIMIGGENSYGEGGYYRTPIEKALPVDMDVEQHKKYATVAMVVIIDKSGSMSNVNKGRMKADLANEGAINVLEMLYKNDIMGVIACDSVPKWALDIGKVADKEAAIDQIASIRAGGGGIYVYASLFEASYKLAKVDANLKHIILFADSSDAEEQIGLNGEHVYSLASRIYKENKITISTIGIGRPNDRDIEFLRKTARYGNGRFYFTTDSLTLPQIFTKEAFVVSKALTVEGNFVPIKKDYTLDIDVDLSAMPPLKGYIATTPKKFATVPYITPEKAPLLAMWQYGLGRAVAFTSSSTSGWAGAWLGTDSYSAFWSQIARWSLKKEDSSNFDVDITAKDSALTIVANVFNEQGEPLNSADMKAVLASPDLVAKTVDMKQIGIGKYSTTGAFNGIGTYLVNVSRYEEGVVKESVNTGITVPYLDEHKKNDVNHQLLANMTSVANGKLLSDPSDVFKHTKEPISTHNTITAPLILLAIILFVLEIMIRKITFRKEGTEAK